MDPFQVKKRKRLEAIKNMLKKLEKTDFRSFVAKISANSGIDEPTVIRYLATLETAGLIEKRNGTITWKGMQD